MAVASVIAIVIAAAASAYAAYSASEAQQEAANYQKKIARRQEEASKQAGLIAEQNEREQNRHIQAALRARIGASGAEEDIGAPLLAEMESAANAELNARRIKWSAETRSGGYEAEAVGQGFAAKQARRQGYIQVGAALMTGAAKAGAAGYGSGGGGNQIAEDA